MRDFAPLRGDRQQLRDAIDQVLYVDGGGTPLYDAVATAYGEMTKRAQRGRINALVVLSEDTDSRTSLAALVRTIRGSAKEGAAPAPVRIFTIAYGKEADKGVLRRISTASGGQMFDATDSRQIGEVFASVLHNF